jgi:hypothetical protein
MAEGAVQAVKTAPIAGRQASAPVTIPRHMLSQPGEAAERSAHARAARAMSGAPAARGQHPPRSRYLPPGTPPEIAAQAGHGRPLPPDLAADFGSRLGADLRHVLIHHDDAAAAVAEAAQARAFTLGSHVFFGPGEYAPDRPAGRALLAHELAHAAEAGSDPGPARVLRQPKGKSVDETFSRLEVFSNSMDNAAKLLAAVPVGEGVRWVFIGLSPRFFKAYDSQGNVLGRVDTKDSENVTFLPGIYVEGPDGLNAITVSDLNPRRLSTEVDAQGRHRSQIGQRPLTEEEEKAAEAEQKQAAAEKRAPKPVINNVSMRDMLQDPNALVSLVDSAPHTGVIYFVPTFNNLPSGGGPGGGEQASAHASPIAGRADGKPPNAPSWPVTLEGPKLVPVNANPTFEAKIDWTQGGSYGFAAQVISQVGENIHYRWELFNVTEHVKKEQAKAAKKKKTDKGAPPPPKTLDERIKEFTASRQGTGEDVTGMGGANREFRREFEDWWKDTKRAYHGVGTPSGDTVAEQLSNAEASRLALELTPASLIITAIHAALSWAAELFAGPRKQQEVPLNSTGIFFIRVITTPAVTEDNKGNEVIRAPSVASKVVDVEEMDRTVEESLDEPSDQLAELQEQIDTAILNHDEDRARYLKHLLGEAQVRFFGSPRAFLEQRKKQVGTDLSLSPYTRQQNLEKIDEQLKNYEAHEKERTEGATGLADAARVQASLISEVTGEQYPLLLVAGPMPKDGNQFRWMLSDVTSGSGDAYIGQAATPSAAFKSALEKFAKKAAYGRGRIGVRTDGLGLEAGAPAQILVDSAPADWALATKRIEDLVTTLVMLGLIVETAGTAGAIIGAGAAAAKLIQRWQAGHLSLDSETVGDVLSLLGGLGAAGKLAGELRVVRFEGAFTVMKEGAATEEELASAGKALADAKSLAAGAKLANEAIGKAGMIWGDLSVVANMVTINEQEERGEITHAAARRGRAQAMSSAIQNHMVLIAELAAAGKGGKAGKAGGAGKAAPHEPATHEQTKHQEAVGEPVAGEPVAGEPERKAGEPEEKAGELEQTAHEREAAHEKRLRESLPSDLRNLFVFGDVEGDAARIDWTPDADGLVGKIEIHAGSETTPEMLRLHVETVRTMQKYQGFAGRIRRALSWIAEVFHVETLDPTKPEFATKLEIDKLTKIVAEHMRAMKAMEPDAREIAETKLDILQTQLEEHMASLEIGEPSPETSVAARGVPKKNLKKYNELLAKLRKYKPRSDEHKETRWELYELTSGKKLSKASWENVYEASTRNALRGQKAAEGERARLGWPEGQYEIPMKGFASNRRLDLANPGSREGAEVKAYGQGTVYLSSDGITDQVERDAAIVKQERWKLTWIFVDCDPSGPLQEALRRSGIIVERRTSVKGGDSVLKDRKYPPPLRR